jgi:hypothetical protein
MFPKTGNKLHGPNGPLAIQAVLAEALGNELGQTHRAVKLAMRWTGASERSVKHWFAGTHAPSACHLVELMRHSDAVLTCVMFAAGRPSQVLACELISVRTQLASALETMDCIIGTPEPGPSSATYQA